MYIIRDKIFNGSGNENVSSVKQNGKQIDTRPNEEKYARGGIVF